MLSMTVSPSVGKTRVGGSGGMVSIRNLAVADQAVVSAARQARTRQK
jgi:hypothetical protein